MKNKVNRTEIINGWLRYYDTTAEEVVKKHPEEAKNGEWFNLYPVTQEQHDQWEAWAKEYVKKNAKLPKNIIERGWNFLYLDTAPKIKQ